MSHLCPHVVIQVDNSAFWKSLKEGLRFHTGTAAFGSLIIAIIKVTTTTHARHSCASRRILGFSQVWCTSYQPVWFAGTSVQFTDTKATLDGWKSASVVKMTKIIIDIRRIAGSYSKPKTFEEGPASGTFAPSAVFAKKRTFHRPIDIQNVVSVALPLRVLVPDAFRVSPSSFASLLASSVGATLRGWVDPLQSTTRQKYRMRGLLAEEMVNDENKCTHECLREI